MPPIVASDWRPTKAGDLYSDEELEATPVYGSMTQYLRVDAQNKLALLTLSRQAITQMWVAMQQGEMEVRPLHQTPKHQIIDLDIPVTVMMRGIAKVKVPLHHTAIDIDDALDTIEPTELDNFEPCDELDWWQPKVSKHHNTLGKIGEAFRRLEAMNIFAIASEYDNSGSQGEADDAKLSHPRYIGYAFIHHQAIEAFLKTGTAHIGYGAFGATGSTGDVSKHINIGRQIVEVLTMMKLDVLWNEHADRKIVVRA